MAPRDPRHLAVPATTAGMLMVSYLLLRPYGDHGGPPDLAAAAAFASPWWVVAHLAGALALAQVGRIALRLHDLLGSPLTAVGRWSGLAGTVLVLPYYGAETFGLHAVGRMALTDSSVLPLVEDIRTQPAAMVSFALGLALLAAGGVAVAIAWQRATRSGALEAPGWAAWPLAAAIALVLPQFYLPPTGRMAFGILFGVAALVLAVCASRATLRPSQSPTSSLPRATMFGSGA